jgi:hypothetical protein
MAYETLLNVSTSALSVVTSTVGSSAYNATIVLDLSNTTLGNSLTDDYAVLNIGTTVASNGNTLSATTPGTSISLSLSSASVIPSTVVYYGNIVSSTFLANTSATLSINFPVTNANLVNVNLPTTVLAVSANVGTSTLLGSVLDNFFWVTKTPAENAANQPNAVRTTAGHARLAAALG